MYDRYDLRNNRCWQVPDVKIVAYGTETIRYRGPKTWELLPSDIKKAKSLVEFKAKIKKWKAQGCTCRLCQLCLPLWFHLNIAFTYFYYFSFIAYLY